MPFGMRIFAEILGGPAGAGKMFEDVWEEFGVRISIDREVKREEIKARLVKPGLLEIEWPRAKGEEVPIE